MASTYAGFIIMFLSAILHVVNSSGSIEFRLIASRSCNVKLCVKKPRARPLDSCLLESRRIYLHSQQQRVVSTPFHFPFPDRFILVTEVYDVTGVLLSNSTSKETFIIGTEFSPAVGSTDFLDIAFRSSCDPSYYGSGCQRYCKSSFTYTCDIHGKKICATGWSGEQCDEPICSNGCTHGRCVEPGRCECDPGYFGPTCNDCRRSEKCRHGTCRDNKPFTCECETGWGGFYCERDLEYCSRHQPCKNGGVCTNGGLTTDFTCRCPEAFVGATCEIEVPSICQYSGICRNGGICTDSDSKLGRCLCVKGFEGRYCERKIVQFHCMKNICKNGGSCLDESKCICPSCFSGHDCSIIDKSCLWQQSNVSMIASFDSDGNQQTTSLRILMFTAVASIMLLASCMMTFLIKYKKMKRLLRDPITQNALNERRQICANLTNQAVDHRSQLDDSYKIFVIPSKKHGMNEAKKLCDVESETRYVIQPRGRYCTLPPCMDVVTAEPEHHYTEIDFGPSTVSADDKKFSENACVV